MEGRRDEKARTILSQTRETDVRRAKRGNLVREGKTNLFSALSSKAQLNSNMFRLNKAASIRRHEHNPVLSVPQTWRSP